MRLFLRSIEIYLSRTCTPFQTREFHDLLKITTMKIRIDIVYDTLQACIYMHICMYICIKFLRQFRTFSG